MVKSIYATNKEMRTYSGRFLAGEYSPARRLPIASDIPARTSAYPEQVVRVRPRHPFVIDNISLDTSARLPPRIDITRMPTVPQPHMLWQQDAPRHTAKSSLASLTLTITDAALTALRPYTAVSQDLCQHQVRSLPRKQALVTRLHVHDIAEFDTVPPLLSHPFAMHVQRPLYQRPMDSLRWWLLSPGRLEFILWFVGTLLLILVTVLFVLFLLSSLGYLVVR